VYFDPSSRIRQLLTGDETDNAPPYGAYFSLCWEFVAYFEGFLNLCRWAADCCA
jgi:hypothetical protein